MGLIKPRENVVDHFVTSGTFITSPQNANTELLVPVKVDVSEISMIIGTLMGASGGTEDITSFIAAAKFGVTGQWNSSIQLNNGGYYTQEHTIYNNSQGLVVVGFDAGLFHAGGLAYQVVIVKK